MIAPRKRGCILISRICESWAWIVYISPLGWERNSLRILSHPCWLPGYDTTGWGSSSLLQLLLWEKKVMLWLQLTVYLMRYAVLKASASLNILWHTQPTLYHSNKKSVEVNMNRTTLVNILNNKWIKGWVELCLASHYNRSLIVLGSYFRNYFPIFFVWLCF